MVRLEIKKIVPNWITNSDGDKIKNEIINIISSGEKVEISFDGISGVNSSFVNSAFVDLLTEYDFNFIKNNVTFIDSNRQINSLIRSRFDFEMNNKKELTLV